MTTRLEDCIKARDAQIKEIERDFDGDMREGMIHGVLIMAADVVRILSWKPSEEEIEKVENAISEAGNAVVGMQGEEYTLAKAALNAVFGGKK